MDEATQLANLKTRAYIAAADSGEESQKWSSSTSLDMYYLSKEIDYCITLSDTVRTTELLNFATDQGWTQTIET